MRPKLIEIPKRPEASFEVIDYNRSYFHNPIHFHSYFELTLILEGQGIRIVGDHVENFDKGDLILLGPNLPHQWKSNFSISSKISFTVAKAIVVHFHEDFLGHDFFCAPELSKIQKLLNYAKRGLKITGKTQIEVIDRMNMLLQCSGVKRIQEFLGILDLLSVKDNIPLASISYQIHNKTNKLEKLDKVYEYVLKHLYRKIPLSEIASEFGMSRTGFSRYFKTHTHKTFSRFVLETRIGIACKLLQENKFNVAQIAYESGFNQQSFFNKEFKRVKGLTPLEYKKKIQKSMDFMSTN